MELVRDECLEVGGMCMVGMTLTLVLLEYYRSTIIESLMTSSLPMFKL